MRPETRQQNNTKAMPLYESKRNHVRVRTTPAEIEKYRYIKQCLASCQAVISSAYETLKAVYNAEGLPMSGGLDTPGLFAPESESIKKAHAAYDRAVMFRRKTVLLLGGAKTLTRLHHLELAGVL